MNDEYDPGLVSVVMPTYNRGHIVTEAMDSIWAQVYRPIELLVVDDGSTDNTRQVIEQWRRTHSGDPKFHLRFFSYEKNKGAPVARNLGLIESRGEFIQFLDSDDLIGPHKISDAVRVLRDDGEVDLVYSLCEDIDVATGRKSPWQVPLANLEKNPFPAEAALRPVWTALPVFRRLVVFYAGPWHEELSCHQDTEFMARSLLVVRKCRQINKVQAFFRQHGGARISKKSWGHMDSVVSYLKATRSHYAMVTAVDGSQKHLTLAVLAGRCLSCVRVAVANGKTRLARRMVLDNQDVIQHRRLGLLEARFWHIISFIPGKVTRTILKPLAQFKNRLKRKGL